METKQRHHIYAAIARGRPDAMERLEQCLDAWGEAAWEQPLRSVYTVMDAVTHVEDHPLRERLLDRLALVYPAGHQVWEKTNHLSVEHDWALVEYYRKKGGSRWEFNHERSLLTHCVIASPDGFVVESPSGFVFHQDAEALEVFDRLLEDIPQEARAFELADAWQWAVMGGKGMFMEKILTMGTIDVNQRMLGDRRKHTLAAPGGMDVVDRLQKNWMNSTLEDPRFEAFFKLLEHHGLDWSAVPNRWNMLDPAYVVGVKRWHHECLAEKLEKQWPENLNRNSGKAGPRL